MKLKKIAALLSLAVVFACSYSVAASSENGTDLSQDTEGESVFSLCELFPSTCGYTPNGGGNGSGNEPPTDND